jgi:CBS domain containing-hemolysin-like protein
MVAACVIFLCILLEGFFSGSEIAIVSSNWIRMRRLASGGDRRAALLERLWANPDRLLATTLVGTNLSIITGSVMATYLIIRHLTAPGAWLSSMAGKEELLVTFLLAPITLTFGEILPKTTFQRRPDTMARRCAYPMVLAWLIFYPLTTVLASISGAVKKVVRARIETSPFVTREELDMIVRMKGLKTGLKSHEERMIRRLLGFRETKVREVMVPLVRVVALDERMTLEQALSTFNRTRHSRYPVFRNQLINVIGMINMIETLHEPDTGRKIGRLMSSPHFVPEGKSVVDLLGDMEGNNIHMAVVVDEYGGTVGIVTKEDILEEIVGELDDEFQIDKKNIRRLGDRLYDVDAHMDLEYISEKLGLFFPEGDYETPAGLMIDRLGRIPLQGEEIRLEGDLILTAETVTSRTVERIVIRTKD